MIYKSTKLTKVLYFLKLQTLKDLSMWECNAICINAFNDVNSEPILSFISEITVA